LKRSEVQCREGGKSGTLWEKCMSNKMVRSEGLVLNPEYNMSGKIY
jgi:hypothetical protein